MLVVGCDFAVKFLIFVRPQNLSKCGVILLQALRCNALSRWQVMLIFKAPGLAGRWHNRESALHLLWK